MIEKTLVLIKPDGVQRSLVGEIISRFEKAGLKIIGMKIVRLWRWFLRGFILWTMSEELSERLSHSKTISFKYMFKHKHNMSGFKTITIKKDVYERLKRIKKKNESFSEYFSRISEPKKINLFDYYGIWDLSENESEKMKKEIMENRNKEVRTW